MHSVIGVPCYMLAEVSNDPVDFAESTGYLLDAEDLLRAKGEYVEAVKNILGEFANTTNILESYDEEGMYVVSPVVGLQLKIAGDRIAYVKAVPFVMESNSVKGESNV